MVGWIPQINVATPRPVQEAAQMREEEEKDEQAHGCGDTRSQHCTRSLHGHCEGWTQICTDRLLEATLWVLQHKRAQQVLILDHVIGARDCVTRHALQLVF